MGVKSNVQGADESKKKSFPKLMESKGSDSKVVLFTSSGKGTVVSRPQPEPVGEYSDFWNMNHFTDFEGTITLENE